MVLNTAVTSDPFVRHLKLESFTLDLGFLGALLSIVIIDLVLSGDNAVVIGMAASRLPASQRRKAIIWGGAGAVGLRMFFTVLAALLLDVPLLQATGAFLLLYIAFKLLKPAAASHSPEVAAAGSLREALQTIIMADVIMSLDNILAVGGAAHGHLGLLIFGLALSIPILLFGSSLIARAIDSYPILNYIGSGILVATAARMFFEDDVVHDYIAVDLPVEIAIIAAVTAIVLGISYWRNRRAHTAALATARARIAEGKSTKEALGPEETVPGA
jgi:YjbE family integral membrane protein